MYCEQNPISFDSLTHLFGNFSTGLTPLLVSGLLPVLRQACLLQGLLHYPKLLEPKVLQNSQKQGLGVYEYLAVCSARSELLELKDVKCWLLVCFFADSLATAFLIEFSLAEEEEDLFILFRISIIFLRNSIRNIPHYRHQNLLSSTHPKIQNQSQTLYRFKKQTNTQFISLYIFTKTWRKQGKTRGSTQWLSVISRNLWPLWLTWNITYLLPSSVVPGSIVRINLSHDKKQQERRREAEEKVYKEFEFRKAGVVNKILEE